MFELHCDTSKIGIGAILIQQNKLVTCYSEKLFGSRARCNTYNVEFYTIIQAIRR